MTPSPDAEGAYAVWLAARSAETSPPEHRRVRVREKLSDSGACLLTAVRDGEIVGMLLAEPFRTDAGAGDPLPDRGHISMVFVDPAWQGRGVGRELVTRLVHEGGWAGLSLWTGEGNAPAQGLYAACGFTPTAEVGELPDGRTIRRWERISG